MKSDFLNRGGYNYLSVKKLVFILSLSISLTVSCKRDETLDIRNTEYISFKINDDALSAIGTLTKGTCDTLSYEITDWDYTGEESDTDVQTKGTLTEYLSGEVGMFAQWSESSSFAMNNAKHTVNGSELIPDTKVLWKNYTSGKLSFFGYAPYNSTMPIYDDGKKYINYVVSTDVLQQQDMLCAVKKDVSCTGSRAAVPLSFKHGLTAIQFKIGFACIVKSVSIKNVKNRKSRPFYTYGRDFSIRSGGFRVPPEPAARSFVPRLYRHI